MTFRAALVSLIRERTPRQRALSSACRFLSFSFFSPLFLEGIRAVKARSVSFAGVGGGGGGGGRIRLKKTSTLGASWQPAAILQTGDAEVEVSLEHKVPRARRFCEAEKKE